MKRINRDIWFIVTGLLWAFSMFAASRYGTWKEVPGPICAVYALAGLGFLSIVSVSAMDWMDGTFKK